MVDPIGNKASVVALRRIAPVSAPSSPEGAQAARTGAALESGAAALTRSLAASPPVDAARVVELRQAIAEGRYALDPAATADALLARKADWSGK